MHFVLYHPALRHELCCNLNNCFHSFTSRIALTKNRRTKKLRFSVRRYIALLFVFCLLCLEEEILEATEVMEVEADEFDHRSGIFLSKTFNNIGMMLGIL